MDGIPLFLLDNKIFVVKKLKKNYATAQCFVLTCSCWTKFLNRYCLFVDDTILPKPWSEMGSDESWTSVKLGENSKEYKTIHKKFTKDVEKSARVIYNVRTVNTMTLLSRSRKLFSSQCLHKIIYFQQLGYSCHHGQLVTY